MSFSFPGKEGNQQQELKITPFVAQERREDATPPSPRCQRRRNEANNGWLRPCWSQYFPKPLVNMYLLGLAPVEVLFEVLGALQEPIRDLGMTQTMRQLLLQAKSPGQPIPPGTNSYSKRIVLGNSTVFGL